MAKGQGITEEVMRDEIGDVRFSGPLHPDVRKHQRTAAFGGAD
jgi:hypothetical protein